MKNLKFVQLQKDNEEHCKLLESLMIPYNKEVDEHQKRVTPEDLILKVTRSMLNMQGPSDRHFELCYDRKNLIGFLYGKVDHIGHKGFIKPDYGYIMEFYVKPEFRRAGYGKAMFKRLEQLFASHGVKRMYLTADPVTGKPFWTAMGFEATGEASPENGLEILEEDVMKQPDIITSELSSLLSAMPATLHEAEYVSVLYRQNIEALHGTIISLDEFRTMLASDDPDEKNFLICHSCVPVAWLKINGLQGKDIAWISMLVVSDKHQRHGIGTYAVQYAEEYIKVKGFSRVGIHTTDDNTPARNLYEKCRYVITSQKECITGDGSTHMEYTFEKVV